jgi:hypothetical protein
MKINRKNIIIALLLFLGILSIYSFSFQNIYSSVKIELASENNSGEDRSLSGFELFEDEQVANKTEISSNVVYGNLIKQFQLFTRLSQTFIVIWQPPNIC